MPLVTGIASFPSVFTPKMAKGASEPKYSITVLIPPGDPQIESLKAEVETAKANAFPNGYTGTDECFNEYDKKYKGKDYYDPRFSGWWVFSCSAKQNDKPAVVNMQHEDIIDPGTLRGGMIVHVNAGISGYTKGRGGIGGWLNGVMVTGEMGEMGDLSGRPSVEQMFASVGQAPQQAVATPTPPPAAPAAPTPPPAAPGPVMTAAANGISYEAYKSQGWTDDQLVAAGLMQAPSF